MLKKGEGCIIFTNNDRCTVSKYLPYTRFQIAVLVNDYLKLGGALSAVCVMSEVGRLGGPAQTKLTCVVLSLNIDIIVL